MQEHGGPLQGLALPKLVKSTVSVSPSSRMEMSFAAGWQGRAEEGAQAHAHAVQQVLRAQERAGHT